MILIFYEMFQHFWAPIIVVVTLPETLQHFVVEKMMNGRP